MRFANLDLGIIIVELTLTTFGASFIFEAAWAVSKIDRNINQTTNLGKFSLPKSMKHTVLFFLFCFLQPTGGASRGFASVTIRYQFHHIFE